MKHVTTLALAIIFTACAPVIIPVSGTITPEVQQNISPATALSVNLNINHQQAQRLTAINIAPSWDIELNLSSPMENAITELIENKFPDISNKSTTGIFITIHEITYAVSRTKANPSALHINAKITADINTPGESFSRSFRHKSTIPVMGINTTFFHDVNVASEAMILKFVIDLDKFIQSTKI